MPQNRFYSSTAVNTTLSAPGATSGATSIVVGATTGFPLSYPYTLCIDPSTANQELVSVVSASGLTLTVVRGQDGSAAVAHSPGVPVVHDVSARDYDEPQKHMADSSFVHGLTGTVVGTSDTQTLTNKTLTTPKIGQISNTGTLTLPTATDTLVARNVAETLTNKTMTGAVLDGTSTVGGALGSDVASVTSGALSAWTAFTPVVSGGTFSSSECAYKVIGKTAFVRIHATIGTLTASQIAPQLPSGVTPVTTGPATFIAAATIEHSGVPLPASVTFARNVRPLNVYNSAGAAIGTGAGSVGDIINCNVAFEIN